MNKFIKFLLFSLFFLIQLSAFAAKQKPLTVMLDWYINPNHAPLFVAEQEGFFKELGLKVKFISPSDAVQGEKLVAAGRADIAISYQPALVRHVAKGFPLMRFATLIDVPLNCFVFLKNGKIKSLKDLKGKRVGYSALFDDSMMLNMILKDAGLNTSDLEMIDVKFNLIQSLLANRIDGFMGGMRNFEPLAIELEGKEVDLFYPEEHGFPKYDELIFITNKNKINDPRLAKFTQALKKGVLYLKGNPKKTWEKFSKKHPELNTELNKKSWFATIKYFADDPAKLNREQYEKLAKFMYERGIIKKVPVFEDYAVGL